MRFPCQLMLVSQPCRTLVKSKGKFTNQPGKSGHGNSECVKGGGLRSPNSIRHKGKRLTEHLEAHQRFVCGDETGARADLAGADLNHIDLKNANLSGANLKGANLAGARLDQALPMQLAPRRIRSSA